MESSPGTAELEGSTLGHSSRDNSQANVRTNRNRTSSGFLLDSAYSTASSRNVSSDQHTHRSHRTDGDKRRHVDDEIIVPKKRTAPNRGQHQQRRLLGTSPLTAVTNVSTPEGHDSNQNEPASSRHASLSNSHSSNVGLDTDPMQIVNLALNLSESRRRTTAGRTPSSPLPGIPRNVSNNQGIFSSSDNAHRALAGNKGSRHFSLYSQENRRSPITHEALVGSSSVAGMLPISNLEDGEIACSKATLARVEKTKQHFELLSKYLELLPYLPPLLHSSYNIRSRSGRAYNPLQVIRNRKVRLREKKVINPEAEGWQDVLRVKDWFASVEATLDQNKEDPYQCIALPPYSNNPEERLVEHQDSWHTTSPPSTALGTNNPGTKIQRPRLDWVISPAELLADAVWLENGSNKTKVIDRDGEKLYPDASKLKFPELPSNRGHPDSIYQNNQLPTEGLDAFPSFDDNKRETHTDHEQNWSKPSNTQATYPDTNTVDSVRVPKWTRSSSISDDSSDDVISRGRSRRTSRRARMKSEAALQAEKLQRVLHRYSDSSNAGSKRLKQAPQPVNAEDHMLISPTGSITGREDRRMSIDEMDSTAPNSPAQGPIFPSITANLSPPSSRSPSPRKRIPRVIGSLHERTKNRRQNHMEQGEGFDESPSDFSQIRKRPATESSPKDNESPKALQPSPLPEPPYGQDYMSFDDFRRAESHGALKPNSSHESKLKGFLKNSRIAEIVGNEVSKVGDMIRRKDGYGHSRQSSYASSIISDLRESDEEKSDSESIPSKQNSLHKGNTFSDDESGLPWRKLNGRTSTKPFSSNLPPIVSSFQENDQNESSDFDRLQPLESRVSDVHFVRSHPSILPTSLDNSPRGEPRDSYGFGAPSSDLNTKHIPAPAIHPPVTGLTNTEVSTNKRPPLSTGSRGWSLSDRSVPTLNDTNLIEKREILRCQALLLSSGVKASEIVHRYEQPRDPPPQFLVQSLVDQNAPIPRVPRIDEFNYAARNLLERLEDTKAGLNKSMYRFSKVTLLPLEKEIDNLEDLINNSLTLRVRIAAEEAESLSTQLNTTSTLAIKQLSETLNKGVRKRNRRFRSIRRIGFSLLEWTLVSAMWWVWLIVMIFRIIRGIGKGVVKGIRWVLWI